MTAPGKVAILIPSGRAWEADTAMCVAAILHYSSLRGIPTILVNQKQSMISEARNALVDRALGYGAEWLFFLDSDMVVPHDTLEILLSHDKDIVGATYNKRVAPYQTLGHLIGPPQEITGGIHEADALPGGCLLIRAEVFRKIGYPYFFETYTWAAESPMTSFIKMLSDWSFIPMPMEVRSALLANPKIQEWLEANEDFKTRSFEPGRTSGEDYNFCRKAIKAGFRIWCDFDITFRSAHIGEHHVTCLPAPKAVEVADAA